MNPSLRIAVADDEPRMREFYQEILPLLGHEVVCNVATGTELIAGCKATKPHLVITDIRMPDMSGIDATREICLQDPLPIILVSAHDDAELLERAGENHVLAYLVKPIKKQDLQPAIRIAALRFEEFQSLRKEATDLRQALQDRKVIERAKGILMRRTGQDEATAFRSLQKLARDKNRKLAQVAEMIITADEAFDSTEGKN
jgi:two-component system, response regulator PdtaR